MKNMILGSLQLFFFVFSTQLFAGEASGTGSMIAGPLIRVWGDAYTMHSPNSAIKYKGSNPADGIHKVINKEADFSGMDMPLSLEQLNKDGLVQFPVSLGGIAPIINLPNVYPGQLKLDGDVLASIFLGEINRWDDPVLVALNPDIKLPSEHIVIIHRVSPPGVSTIIGDYLSKHSVLWKTQKGDGMAGNWPAGSVEVKDLTDNVAKNKEIKYSIGYLAVPQIMKNKLNYTKMKTKSGNFISPSDENISAAAVNATWDSSNGFDVRLTDQPGNDSWPLSFASFVLMKKESPRPEHSKELLQFFKYSLRYGGLKAIQYDYIPLPDSVRESISSALGSVVDEKGVPLLKH
ncbi:MAG: phosphate ABC transporter substrate-binding protein PstS [Gallionellaceae bacterium]